MKNQKLMPEKIEDAQQEIRRLWQQKKKLKTSAAWFVFLALLLGLGVGLTMGMQSGYHSALVDFGIIQGMLI